MCIGVIFMTIRTSKLSGKRLYPASIVLLGLYLCFTTIGICWGIKTFPITNSSFVLTFSNVVALDFSFLLFISFSATYGLLSFLDIPVVFTLGFINSYGMCSEYMAFKNLREVFYVFLVLLFLLSLCFEATVMTSCSINSFASNFNTKRFRKCILFFAVPPVVFLASIFLYHIKFL